MNALEAAYWAGARDAAAVIYSDLSHLPWVRPKTRERARALLLVMNELGGQDLDEQVHRRLPTLNAHDGAGRRAR